MRCCVGFVVLSVSVLIGCQQQQESETLKERVPSSTADSDRHSDNGTSTEMIRPPMQGNRQMQGSGMMMRGGGPTAMGEMREDMMTLHALFNGREKIRRSVKNLSNGAETLTESDDDEIATLLHKHVPAMEGRVLSNEPLPPMRFHPLFQELIKKAEKVAFDYEETDHGIKVVYTSDDPYVVLLIQEHAKLVSRFIENGMQELHKPYKIPETKSKGKTGKTEQEHR